MSAATGPLLAQAAYAASLNPIPTRQKSASLVWLAATASILLVLALTAAGQATLVRIAIPAGATLIALALYQRRPIGYVHFALWAWFLTPLVRRLVDWRMGFQEQNLILLVPFLVSSIAGLTFIRERNNPRLQLTPFVLCMAGIFYGFLVGIVRLQLHASAAISLGAIVYGLFNWLAPLLFGLHLYIRWQMYNEHKQAIQKSFMWAVLLLGLYGIFQYVVAPPWDCAWLEGLPMGFENASFGIPAPYGIRVWSTMNAPGAFATVMFAGLILLFGTRARYKFIFAAAGYIALLLSMVRSAWLGWLLAMILLLSSYRGAMLRRFILGLVLLPLCLLPLLLSPQIAQSIQDRVVTMQSMGKDTSFQERKLMYQVVTAELVDKPSGVGLLSDLSVDGFPLDSGILQTVLMLGFTGAALFGTGILLALRTMIRPRLSGHSASLSGEEVAYRAIFLVSVVELISGNNFINVGGAVLWMTLGLWMSSAVSIEAQNSPAQELPNGLLSPLYSD